MKLDQSTVQFRSICHPSVTVTHLTKFLFRHPAQRAVTSSVGLTRQSRQWPTRPWPTDPELTGLTLGQSTSVTRDAPH